jgi:putative ABC transport system ATP-binding protein
VIGADHLSPVPLLSLQGVSRTYPREDGDVHALEGVALTIRRGEFVAVTGPSGSGKSTLLHVLSLLDTPTAGRYELDGVDVSGLGDTQRARLRNQRIGVVFQAFQLVPHLTVAENVELPLVYRRLDRKLRFARSREALERVGLGQRLTHLPDELSGGEQQRAAIARALAAEPDVLLADEPTGNLDEAATDGVLGLFRDAHRAGTTVVVVTHNARVAARADRRYEMSAGRLRPAEETSASSAGP